MKLELEFKKGVDIDFLHDRLEEAAKEKDVKIPRVSKRRWFKKDVFEKYMMIEALEEDIQALTSRIQDFAVSKHYRPSEHILQGEREKWYRQLKSMHETELERLREELGL